MVSRDEEVVLSWILERSRGEDSLDKSDRARIKRRIVRSRKLLDSGLGDIEKAYKMLDDAERILDKVDK